MSHPWRARFPAIPCYRVRNRFQQIDTAIRKSSVRAKRRADSIAIRARNKWSARRGGERKCVCSGNYASRLAKDEPGQSTAAEARPHSAHGEGDQTDEGAPVKQVQTVRNAPLQNCGVGFVMNKEGAFSHAAKNNGSSGSDNNRLRAIALPSGRRDVAFMRFPETPRQNKCLRLRRNRERASNELPSATHGPANGPRCNATIA
jgi:hypothetical protein